MLKLHAMLFILILTAADLRSQSASKPNVEEDYIYGYAPITMWATEAILTAVPNNTTTPHYAPINQFSYGTTLSGPGVNPLFPEPNADTLYNDAWLDLSKGPIILHVPNPGGRFYLVPMLDAYSNVFATIGSRTTGTDAGNYAIVGPRWFGRSIDGVNGIVKAPTNTVWLLGRTFVNGPSDLANAVAISSLFNLIPLEDFRHFLRTGSYTPPADVPVTTPNPNFDALPPGSSSGFSAPEFFDVLLQYSIENPPPADQSPQAWALVLDGLIHKNKLNSSVVSDATTAMINDITTAGAVSNGWSYDLNVGSFGTNYLNRAAYAKFALGANIPADAVYYHAETDVTGAPLTGTNSYDIHFAAGQTPPAQGFWSITVYDQQGYLVTNPINRYDVGSATGLVPNADGSIDIYLQNTGPQTMQSNWLPIPAAPFTVTLRVYWPGETVLNGTWTAPSLSETAAPLP